MGLKITACLCSRGKLWTPDTKRPKNPTATSDWACRKNRVLEAKAGYWACTHHHQFSSLQPHGLQHTRPPCPSPTAGVYSNSCPSSQWCHPTILSSVVPFSCLQSFPASESFPMSQFFESGGQRIRVSASASVLPLNIQDWFPLGWITTTRGVDKPPKPRFWPSPRTQPYPHPIKGTGLAPPPCSPSAGTSKQGNLFFLTPGAPVKPCLNFF